MATTLGGGTESDCASAGLAETQTNSAAANAKTKRVGVNFRALALIIYFRQAGFARLMIYAHSRI